MSLPQHTKAGPGNKLTIAEAASQSGLSEERLLSLIEDGSLAAVKRNGQSLVEQRDIERLETLQTD